MAFCVLTLDLLRLGRWCAPSLKRWLRASGHGEETSRRRRWLLLLLLLLLLLGVVAVSLGCGLGIGLADR